VRDPIGRRVSCIFGALTRLPLSTEGEPMEEANDVIAGAVQRVLEVHTPAESGLCRGCMQHWSRLIWHPCAQAAWARQLDAVLAAERPAP